MRNLITRPKGYRRIKVRAFQARRPGQDGMIEMGVLSMVYWRRIMLRWQTLSLTSPSSKKGTVSLPCNDHRGVCWFLLKRLCGYRLVATPVWSRKIKAQGLKCQ